MPRLISTFGAWLPSGHQINYWQFANCWHMINTDQHVWRVALHPVIKLLLVICLLLTYIDEHDRPALLINAWSIGLEIREAPVYVLPSKYCMHGRIATSSWSEIEVPGRWWTCCDLLNRLGADLEGGTLCILDEPVEHRRTNWEGGRQWEEMLPSTMIGGGARHCSEAMTSIRWRWCRGTGGVVAGGFFPSLAAPRSIGLGLGVGWLLWRRTSQCEPLPHLLFIVLRDGGPPAVSLGWASPIRTRSRGPSRQLGQDGWDQF
jgi:hypothetical protein